MNTGMRRLFSTNRTNYCLFTGCALTAAVFNLFWINWFLISRRNDVNDDVMDHHNMMANLDSSRITTNKNHQGRLSSLQLPDSKRELTYKFNHRNFNFTIGICAIVKDMEPYLHEWLDYHLIAMNIKNIYLYDNSERNILKNWYDNTRNHPVYKRVHVIHWHSPKRSSQEASYTDCVIRDRFEKDAPVAEWKKGRNNIQQSNQEDSKKGELNSAQGNDYLAFIDGDEFLVPQGNYTNVHEVIKDYLQPYGGALTVNWMLFGSSNKTMYAPIPVTKRFQYREEVPNNIIKTILKTSDFRRIRNPHAVSLQTSEGRVVRTTHAKGQIQKEQFGKTGASDHMLPSTVLLLYHYRYMSESENDRKSCERGHMSKNLCNHKAKKVFTPDEMKRNGKPDHIVSRPGTVFDETAWKILTMRVPKYRFYDDEGLEDYS